MTTTAAQLDPAIWQDLIGAPFEHQGRGPSYDCLGVMLTVHRRMGFNVADPVEAYQGGSFRESWAASWRKIDRPLIGCAVLWKQSDRYHVGVILDEAHVLHTNERHGCVRQRFSPGDISVVGFYWPNGVATDGYGLEKSNTINGPDSPPGDPTGGVAVAFLGVTVFQASATVAALAVAAGNLLIAGAIGFLSQLIAAPKKPALDRGDETRPTFDLGGARLTTASGTTVPVVYGEHIVGGQVVQLFFRAGPDFRTRLYMLIAVSEGPVYSIGGQTADADNLPSSAFTGEQIQINGNPIENYPTARVSVRLGTLSQNPIPGFDETVVAQNVGSLVIHTSGAPAANNAIVAENADTVAVTTTDDIDAFEINLRFPNGLYGQDSSGNSQNYQWFGTLRYYPVGNPTAVVAQVVTCGPRNIKADHTQTIRVQNLTRDKYRISLTRSSLEDNEASAPRFSVCQWTTLNEISMTQALARPGKALIAIEALATDQLSGSIPQVSSIVKGRVVQAWDGSSTTSPTFTSAWSDNPAWVSLDVLLDKRYGLGAEIRLNEIDLTSLKAWADYCAASITTDGVSHSRWQFDHVFDAQQDAWEVLSQIAASGRANVIYSGGVFKWVVNTTTSYSQIFGMGNIIRGSYSASYPNGDRRPNFIEVQYLNRETSWEQDVAQLDNAATGNVRKETVRIVGITRAVQAYRAAKWALNVAAANLKSIRFAASIDAVAVQVGDVFRFAHDVPSIGVSGRVIGNVGGDFLTVDRAVTVGASWTALYRTTNNSTMAETFVSVTPAAGTYAAGQSIALTGVPSAQVRPKDRDVYMMGPTSTYYRDYTVTSVRVLPDFMIEIEGIEYDASTLSDDPGVIETFTDQWPDSRAIIDPPSTVIAREIARVQKDGTCKDEIEVSFTTSRSGVWHDIWYRFACAESGQDDFFGEEWQHAGSTRDLTFRFEHGSTYQRIVEVSVSPRNVGHGSGHPDAGARAMCYVMGRVDAPAAPSSLAVQSLEDRLIVSMTASDSRDVASYELRQSSASDRWLFASRIARCACGSPAIAFPDYYASSYLLGKAVSRSGIPSETAASLAVTPSRLSGATLISDTISGSDWTASGTADTNFTLSGSDFTSDAAATSAQWTSDVDGHNLGKKHVRVHAWLDAKGIDDVTTWSDAWWTWDSLQASRRKWDGELLDVPQPEEETIWDERGDTWASPTCESTDWTGTSSAYALKLEYALSSDSGAASFGDWIEYVGPFETKSNWFVKWRVTFTSAAGNYRAQLLGLTVTVYDLMAGRADTPLVADGALVIDDHFVFSSTESGEIGDYGWTLSGSSATVAIGSRNLATHPGQAEIATVATTGNYAALHSNSSSGHIILGTAVVRFQTLVYLVDTANVTYMLGLVSSVSSTSANGVYFSAAGGNFGFVLKNAGGTTNNNTGVTASAGWWKLEFTIMANVYVAWKITDSSGTVTSGTSVLTRLDTSTALILCHGVHTSANASKTLGIDRTRFIAENLGT